MPGTTVDCHKYDIDMYDGHKSTDFIQKLVSRKRV